jgi:uncharacterized protein (TIGR03790 family)
MAGPKPSGLLAVLVLAGAAASNVLAGGSGLNTVVVINQTSTNSCEVGNYFCERREVPPENVLYINWAGGNISWNSDQFQTNLLQPLLNMLVSRHLTNQVDYVVLSMDIPFQTVNGSTVNGTTSALFYGLKPDPVLGTKSVVNSYAATEAIFRNAKPATAPGYSFLTCMITASTVQQAKRLVDQGVTSDGTFPSQPVVLAKSSDSLRNIRYSAFDNAIFNTRLRGDYLMVRTNSDTPRGQTNLLGYETGLAGFSVSPNAFVPGAMADSLTSFGGIIFGPNGQTSLLAFIAAGAAGSYGTVTEPLADSTKFPDPQAYFYQSRGFTLAESYYQSLAAPFLGLIVAEPLAAPFQHVASGAWLGVNSNAALSGTAQIGVQFTAVDTNHPLQQIDLFIDGKYFQTLTNVAPSAGNVLQLTLNRNSLAYTVPANSTLASIANGLGALINSPALTNLTRMVAFTHGDRIELRALSTNRPPLPPRLGVSTSPGSPDLTSNPPFYSSSVGTADSLTTFLTASRDVFLNSVASGIKAVTVSGSPQIGTWIQCNITKTNGAQVVLSTTNQSASATALDLTRQLVNLINASPDLAGLDGVTAEDLASPFGTAMFNLRCRGSGASAAALRVRLSGAAGLAIAPAAEATLTENQADLQPRNHLYVAAGATRLGLTFPLDTTQLADGFHELTAVAYEGTHVRTQTRITVPVVVQNSALTATLIPLDLADTAPVQGTYHLQVIANTNNVSAIGLFTTGGMLATIPNQSTATFSVAGLNLGAGLHPFFALVQTATGLTYRTQTFWVRLTSGS